MLVMFVQQEAMHLFVAQSYCKIVLMDRQKNEKKRKGNKSGVNRREN